MLHPAALEQTPAINDLPPEILSSVFLALRQIRRFRQVLPFQVTISHVCQHWRGVAISTPQLWTTITLFSEGSLPCVDEWLTRSGGAPLDVRLDLYDVDYQEGLNALWIQESCARILANAHRFQSLLVFTYREMNIYHILQLLEHAEAPLLERLRVSLGHHNQPQELVPFVFGDDFTLPTAFNSGLPKLTFAEIESLRCVPSLTGVTALHLNLVGHIALLHFDRLAEIVQMPHNLVTLSLRGSIGEDNWSIHHDHPYIQLPQLRNLELSGRGATGVRFIVFFGMPKLESLRWHVESDSYYLLHDSPQFQPGMNKFPALSYLTLAHQILSPNYLSTLMRVFPTPTHILCTHPAIPRPSFQKLQLFNGDQGWGDLQVFAFQGVNVRQSGYLAKEIEKVVSARPGLREVLVDQELLSFMGGKTRPFGEVAGLNLLNRDTFSDYWWNSRREFTPECL